MSIRRNSRQRNGQNTQESYRISGLEFFKREWDHDPSCLSMRENFRSLMFHKTGNRTPEDSVAEEIYRGWLDEYSQELVRAVPSTLGQLIMGLERLYSLPAVVQGDVEQSLGSPYTIYPLYPIARISDCIKVIDPVELGDFSTRAYSSHERKLGPIYDDEIGFYSHCALMVGSQYEWDAIKVADFIARVDMPHELLHFLANTVGGVVNEVMVTINGVEMTIGDHDSESHKARGKWVNEALIENLLEQIYERSQQAYFIQNFVLSTLGEFDQDLLKNLFNCAYRRNSTVENVNFEQYELISLFKGELASYLLADAEDFLVSFWKDLELRSEDWGDEQWTRMQIFVDAFSRTETGRDALRYADELTSHQISLRLYLEANDEYTKRELRFVFGDWLKSEERARKVNEKKWVKTRRAAYVAAGAACALSFIGTRNSDLVNCEAKVQGASNDPSTLELFNLNGAYVEAGQPIALPNGRKAIVTVIEPLPGAAISAPCR